MNDLREKTIERLRDEANFDMQYFRPFNFRSRPACNTACCIAGNICLASGMSLDQLCSYEWAQIPRVARRLWAEQYGQLEADRLQFDECGWGSNLDEVTTDEAIAHLNGAPPVVHGLTWEQLNNDD